jgi:hypothetical protein
MTTVAIGLMGLIAALGFIGYRLEVCLVRIAEALEKDRS